MKLKNVLIVVKDIERARQFYHDLFGLEMILDNDGNMILTEGLVLQEEKYWTKFLGRESLPVSIGFAGNYAPWVFQSNFGAFLLYSKDAKESFLTPSLLDTIACTNTGCQPGLKEVTVVLI